MNKITALFALVLLTTAAWALDAPKPYDTDFKTDVCAQCNMVVTSPQYAAQFALQDKGVFFDDIGCLVQYERQGKAKDLAVQARYVRTVGGDAWVAVEKAFWVLTKDVRTPMGYGLHAFADQKAAEAFLKGKKDAKVLSWAEAQKAVPAKMGMM